MVKDSYRRFIRHVVLVTVMVAGMAALASPAVAAAAGHGGLRKDPPTTTTVTGTPNPAAPGTAVTFTATITCTGAAVGSPSGTVNFFDGAAFLGTATVTTTTPTGTASFTTSALAPGTHTINAVYNGDVNCSPSLGSTTETITATSVSVTGSPNPTSVGLPVTLTAVVTCTGDGNPTGSVVFTNSIEGTLGNDATGTTGPGANQRTFTITHAFTTAGSHLITATYSSTNPACVTATSPTFTETVTAAGTSTTTVAASPNPTTVGAPTTLTATVTCTAGTPLGGSVTFFDGAALVGTVPVTTGSPATVSTTTTFATTGAHLITAAYSGTASCTASAGTTTLVVNPVIGTSTTTVTASPSNPSFGQPVTLTAMVACATGSPAGGTVTFTDTTTGTVLGTATVAGGPPTGTASIRVNGLTPGTHNITAAFGGTVTCGPSSGSVTVTVVCGRTISGDQFTSVISNTSTCVTPGSRIHGYITVSGGSLDLEGAQVFGSVTVTGGSGARICGSSASGNTSVTGVSGVVMIGDAGDDGNPPCAGNHLQGSVNVSNNTGHTEFSANTVGGLMTVSRNANTILVPPENATTTEIESNTISGSLGCTGNMPTPTNDGQPNTVHEGESGQCVGL